MAREARDRPEGGGEGRPRLDEGARRRHGRLLERRRPHLDYGNNIRQMAQGGGPGRTPSPSPASSPPTSARSSAAASARSAGARSPATRRTSTRTDAKVKELIPDDPHLHAWLDMAARAHRLPGPARPHLLGRPRPAPPPRPRLQRDGPHRRAEGPHRHRPRPSRLAAPSPAPNRETEAMKDGSDAVSDWPLLNALLNCASGATWVSPPPRRRRRHGLLPALRHGDLLPTAPRRPTPASPACSGTTPPPASCATPTPATRSRSTAPARTACACRRSSGTDAAAL